MRERSVLTGTVLCILLMISGLSFPAAGQDSGFKAEPPVLVTSCGQSPGPATIKLLLKRAKIEVKRIDLATVEDLKSGGYKTLIITMGASLKGMGAAGISIEDEMARAKKLIAEARKMKITVIGAHIDGISRRAQSAAEGDNTDEQSIDCVAPLSDALIVWADGNPDKRFDKIAKEKNIPMFEQEKRTAFTNVFKAMFTK